MPRTDPPTAGYTVADLARRWRIGTGKVRGLIERGELAALNLAANRAGRPQYRVTAEAVAQFEQRRSITPLQKPKRQRRPRPAKTWTDFFPQDQEVA